MNIEILFGAEMKHDKYILNNWFGTNFKHLALYAFHTWPGE